MKAEPRNQLQWRIVPGASSAAGEQDFPGSILTTGAPFHHESMPEEAAILLPMSQGPTRLIERLIEKPAAAGQGDVIVGLFLAPGTGRARINTVSESQTR